MDVLGGIVHSFPALGFDPVPGVPDDLEQLGADCAGFAAELADDARRARALHDGLVWGGPAADAFRGRLEDVPRDLERAGDAYYQAGAALGSFSTVLREHQVRADDLERRAAEQRRLAGDPRVAGGPGGTPASLQHAEDALTELVTQAQALRDRVRSDAQRCNRALYDAMRHAPSPPGWLAAGLHHLAEHVRQVSNKVGDFVRAHAGVIAALAGICSKISSALAIVAMLVGPIPVLGAAVGTAAFVGSMLMGGLALLGHTALAAYAGGSWGAVAFDAVALATAAAPKGVELAAGRLALARGLDLGETQAMSLSQALGTLRHPGQALAAAATSTMTVPELVTRTISYQFDLAAGALGVVDLAATSELGPEVQEARVHAAAVKSS